MVLRYKDVCVCGGGGCVGGGGVNVWIRIVYWWNDNHSSGQSRRFQHYFSHITRVSGCDRELSAHFYSAASLKRLAPDTWHETTPSHIIVTLGRPVLALYPVSLSTKRGAASTIFKDFDVSRPGLEPATGPSPKRTLFQLSYRGR